MSPISGVSAFPIAAWELAIGVWMLVKGFTPSPTTPAVDVTVVDLAVAPVPASV